MRKCINCNIFVGGDADTCPLCQNSLSGDSSENNWPSIEKLKKRALAYKLQLFILLVVAVVSLGLDFLFELNNGKHWSIIVALAVVMVELEIRSIIRKSFVFSRIINMNTLHIIVLITIISLYYGFSRVIILIVIPILLSVMVVFNFIVSLVDKNQNAMVYLLSNILINFVFYIALIIYMYKRTLIWNICIMISVVALIGILVFKGRQVTKEIEKRMNI